jgi:hypothetical protein
MCGDQGYSIQIEAYIRDHFQAEFTHRICPECMNKLYPEVCSEDGKWNNADWAMGEKSVGNRERRNQTVADGDPTLHAPIAKVIEPQMDTDQHRLKKQRNDNRMTAQPNDHWPVTNDQRWMTTEWPLNDSAANDHGMTGKRITIDQWQMTKK